MYHNLYIGCRNPALKPIKKWLNLLTASDNPLTDDDVFDERTKIAVRQFQIQNKSLNPHGMIDEVTLYNILTRIGSRQINEASLENTPFKILVSNVTLPYDDEVHKGLTSVLAMAAGFYNADAERIANNDVGVDYNERTQPLPKGLKDVVSGANCERLKQWHFVTPERLRELDSLWRNNGNLDQLGSYLHVFQDSYSHQGLGSCTGQMWTRVDENGNVRKDAINPFNQDPWHEVDDPSKRPQLAFAMAKETYHKLYEAVGICKAKKTITKTFFLTSWDSIKNDIWSFCNEPEAKKRGEIVARLYTTLYRRQKDFDEMQRKLKSGR